MLHQNRSASRRFVAVPPVGRSLSRHRVDSPRRSWHSATRRVDKTSVGPGDSHTRKSRLAGETTGRPAQRPVDLFG